LRNGNRGRFYLLNALGALDYEREWYYKNGTIYFQAPGNANPNSAVVEMAVRELTINITKKYIQFDGINAFGGRILLAGDYATLRNGNFKHCLERLDELDNTDAQISSGAIDIAADNCLIENNSIEYGSTNGISTSNWQKGINSTIQNNIIRHFNTIGNHSGLIRMSRNNLKVLNNTLYSCGRDALYCGGTDCEIAYNDLYDAMKINNDGGVFYTVGNSNLKNNTLHHNWFHDSKGPDYADGRAAGIYLDNDSKGYLVHHNVIWNVTWTGFQTNWDVWDNQFYNNTLWNIDEAMGAWLPIQNGVQKTIQRTTIYNNYSSTAGWMGTDVQDNIINATNSFIDVESQNFVPKAGSYLIDQGRVISGITDNFSGSKPDMGAYEVGGVAWKPGAIIDGFCNKTWYADADGDGKGDFNVFMEACEQPVGYVAILGDLCPNDAAKTKPGDCGCGVKESTCAETVAFTQALTSLPSIKSIPVYVSYNTTAQRDITVDLVDGNGATIGSNKVTVNAGSGTVKLTITMASAPQPGPSNQLNVFLRPVNGDAQSTIKKTSVTVTILALGTKDCAGTTNGTANVDQCNICSGGTTTIEPKYDGCVVYNDIIDFKKVNTTVIRNLTYNFDVTYEASDKRDLIVSLTSPAPESKWLGAGTVKVEKGTGTVNVSFTLGTLPTAGTGYKLTAIIRPQNTTWNENINTKTQTIELTSISTALNENNTSYFEIYPNPTTGIVHLTKETKWKLLSLSGANLLNGYSATLDIRQLASGIYFLQIKEVNYKLVKK